MSADEQKGVLRRSPFYELPYFCMSMVQYDLMHTAMGVLKTFVKAFTKPGHPLYVTQGGRKKVGAHGTDMSPACHAGA